MIFKLRKPYIEWLNDGKPKIFCSCGCGKEIIITRYHKHEGIPKYVSGHNIPWNKGLNKNNDDRILKYSLSLKNSDKAKKQRNILHILYRGNNHTNHIKIQGNKNPNWNNGITPLYQNIRGCYKSKEWIKNIFERDNFTCCFCNIRGGELNAHHTKQFYIILKENNIKTLDDALKCYELWDVNNGITLCKDCHDKTKTLNSIKNII